ncbi:hypothetical protein PHYPSEUDO_009641 [Phytophthora pseudosyringae]|uniref:DUF6818 domain-containing protein n=1 Tax=Phytophthora pseudosyringae TaxID=221518 RepID=A0A8T1WHU2_9STRA|nr:hypothetical protein PHYPSEUDO_009641 [Phytophthora pseudosyringae]
MIVVIKLTMSLKMPKQQGSTNCTYAEQRRLLEVVRSVLPTCDADWEAVVTGYNATEAVSWKRRGLTSLRRKFTCLHDYQSKASGMNPPELAEDAKAIKAMIKQRVLLGNKLPLSQKTTTPIKHRHSKCKRRSSCRHYEELLTCISALKNAIEMHIE